MNFEDHYFLLGDGFPFSHVSVLQRYQAVISYDELLITKFFWISLGVKKYSLRPFLSVPAEQRQYIGEKMLSSNLLMSFGRRQFDRSLQICVNAVSVLLRKSYESFEWSHQVEYLQVLHQCLQLSLSILVVLSLLGIITIDWCAAAPTKEVLGLLGRNMSQYAILKSFHKLLAVINLSLSLFDFFFQQYSVTKALFKFILI